MKGRTDTLNKLNIELTASVKPGIKLDSSYGSAHRRVTKKMFT